MNFALPVEWITELPKRDVSVPIASTNVMVMIKPVSETEVVTVMNRRLSVNCALVTCRRCLVSRAISSCFPGSEVDYQDYGKGGNSAYLYSEAML